MDEAALVTGLRPPAKPRRRPTVLLLATAPLAELSVLFDDPAVAIDTLLRVLLVGAGFAVVALLDGGGALDRRPSPCLDWWPLDDDVSELYSRSLAWPPLPRRLLPLCLLVALTVDVESDGADDDGAATRRLSGATRPDVRCAATEEELAAAAPFADPRRFVTMTSPDALLLTPITVFLVVVLADFDRRSVP